MSPDTPNSATLRLKVFRDTGAMAYLTVGHSDVEPLASPGLKVIPTRIAVQPGDRLGLRTGPTSSDCVRDVTSGAASGDTTQNSALGEPDPAMGSTFNTTHVFTHGLNVAATVEAHQDGDGFGDETQDQCSTAATTQGPCPVMPVLLDTDPPETTITKDPPNKTDKPNVKYSFVADEASSAFECSLKGKGLDVLIKSFNACLSPRKYKRVHPGKYKFEVRAIDAAGNVDPTADRDKFKALD